MKCPVGPFGPVRCDRPGMQVRECTGYPRDVWKFAAESVVKHTSVGAAYAMVVCPPQEPEFAFEEEDGEEAPDSDDDNDEKPTGEEAGEGEDGQEAEGGEEAPQASGA